MIGIGIGIRLGKGGGSSGPIGPNGAPSELTLTIGSNTEIDGSFTINSTNHEGHHVYMSSDGGATYSLEATVTGATNTFQATGLTTYGLYLFYVKAYLGNAESVASNIQALVATLSIVDLDGNTYTYAEYGNQTWIIENLKTTKYNDNSAIPTGLSNANWALEDGTAGHNGSYAQVNNDAGNKAVYGLLYNFHAIANAKGLALPGFRIATDADITTLVTYLGGSAPIAGAQATAGGMMKEVGTSHWTAANAGATDLFGFKAVGAGYRLADGTYGLFKDYNLIWSSTPVDANNALDVQLNNGTTISTQASQGKKLGMSIRCMKPKSRFRDNYLPSIVSSIAATGEPSALVTLDGEQIDLWFTGLVGGVNNMYYCYSTDGLTFSLPVKTDIPDEYKRGGIMRDGGVYYMYANGKIGATHDQTIHCFSSTDKIHFTDHGEVIGLGAVGAWDHTALGNSFAWKEGSTYYMFFDGYNVALNNYWKTGWASASSPLGPFTKYASNPVFAYADRDTEGAEMFRIDDEIIKLNGNYYAQTAYGVLTTAGSFNDIVRLHSADLQTWVSDGTSKKGTYYYATGYISYADASYCQYKGKSYIFMNPSNQVNAAYIDVGIDNRPLIAMLALTP